MLFGTADIGDLAEGAATIAAYSPDAIELSDVVCCQVTTEMHNRAREAVLPPSLHPTVPASLTIQMWSVGTSPWGAFELATTRVACRSGVRARGFTTMAVVSQAAAAKGLSEILGFPTRVGEVLLRSTYSGVNGSVRYEGKDILAINGIDPEPMGLNDVQYTSTLNLAHTPNGLRLVQVEAHRIASAVDRLTTKLLIFDAAAWGNPLLDPYFVVSSSVAKEQLTFPPLRFVCKVDETAFTGTEPIAS